MADQEQLVILKQGIETWNKWREQNPDVEINLSNLISIDYRFSFIGGRERIIKSGDVKFNATDLSGADFRDADFSATDLWAASLIGSSLLRANLSDANLSDANLRDTNLSRADMSFANLSDANLSFAKVLATNFSSAILTGACIEDWHINNDTKLDDVVCDYVYLKANKQERRPSDPNRKFRPGEFARLVEKSIETVDLVFTEGIDWRAFLNSFQDIQVEYGNENVSIQAIELKNEGAFVIRLNVSSIPNKAEIESKIKLSYETKLKMLETQYREKLQAKDEQIAIHRQHNTDLLDIIKLKAAQPITENNFHAPVGSVGNNGTQSNIAGEVKGD